MKLFAMLALLGNTMITDIQDTSNLPLLNPDLKTRQTAKIRLDNGLEAILISDPMADQSSAAMAVSAGSWDDPDEYPGMAHFCEHMLFMGTKKYPDSNEFMDRVSDSGGITNAFTQGHQTVYIFSSKHTDFNENLDRFSRFFIDPLFDSANISRELHAVDQEYGKNLENDAWREYMVFKELGNPNHPNAKFSSGNSATLSGIPSERLAAWHDEHYGADAMHLAIYSNVPMDDLKQQVATYFNEVPTLKNKTARSQESVTSPKQHGHIAYIKPIRDRQMLTLCWELPPALSNDPSHAAELIAYTLNRGQKYSLYEKLQKEQLINSVSVQVEEMGGKDHRFVYLSLDLSEKGTAKPELAIYHCFEAIAGLRSETIPHYLFEEKNRITALSYQYQSRSDAYKLTESIAESLGDEALSSFPREQIVATEFDESKIKQTLQLLTPENCYIAYSASPAITGVEPDTKERWFGAQYAVRPVPAEWMTLWKSAKANVAIRMPGPNPFLPENFALAAPAEDKPVLVSQSDSGVAYYCRAAEFAGPESVFHLHIRSPQLQDNARSAVLASLYLDHLTDLLHPTLAASRSAGLYTRFDVEKLKLHVQMSGFNDKAPLLLTEILRQMPLQPPTKEQFDLYVARHEKEYANGSKALPVAQAKDLLDSLLMSEKNSCSEKLEAIHTITYEQFLDFHQKLFEKTYTEALFTGNLTLKEAQSCWIDVQHSLSKGLYPPKQHAKPKVLALPNQAGPFSLIRTTTAQGNGTILAIDSGEFSLDTRASQEILTTALREAFFNELRTKQKTGYIAKADCAEIEDRLFQYFYVQSNSHQSEDLLYRYELFFEEFLETLQTTVPQERFENIKHSSIHSLKTRFRNLKDKSTLWNQLAFEKGADFSYIDKRIAALNALTYEQFLSFTKATLSRANLKRLAVLYEGKLPTPFSYQTIDPSALREVSQYVTKSETPETLK